MPYVLLRESLISLTTTLEGLPAHEAKGRFHLIRINKSLGPDLLTHNNAVWDRYQRAIGTTNNV